MPPNSVSKKRVEEEERLTCRKISIDPSYKRARSLPFHSNSSLVVVLSSDVYPIFTQGNHELRQRKRDETSFEHGIPF